MPCMIKTLTCDYHTDPLGIDNPAPALSWQLHDERPGALQSGRRIQVAVMESFADDSIVWDTGETDESGSVRITYAGKVLEAHTRYFWRVRVRDQFGEWSEWSATAFFETAFIESAWDAQWIAPSDLEEGHRDAVPALRRKFELENDFVSARLYISARGLYEAYINGERVGSDLLAPGWTDYGKRVQYITYDVTALLRKGTNAIAALLGDGWYSGRIGCLWDKEYLFGTRPQLLCLLRITDRKGTVRTVASDDGWRWTDSPITASDIYDGENYDARNAIPGWNSADFNDREWKAVAVTDAADAVTLDAKTVPPVRAVETLTPQTKTEPEPGVWIYDLGQNIAGWARVTFKGAANGVIRIRYAEMLNPDGTMYVENLRSAKATDTYICADDSTVTWEPRFTFHGFRYIEVSGCAAAPTLQEVKGIVLHNDLPRTGDFAASHPKLNRLQSNITWGQRGNFLEVPTDCPQRDERLGWTGDAQVFIPTAAYNLNVGSFFTKWQRDLEDAQSPRGVVPSVAPVTRYMSHEEENDGGPAWSDAMVICPWTVYRKYGDRDILAGHYDGMRRFISSMEQDSRGLIRSDEFRMKWGGYGDWVAMDAPEGSCVGATPKDLIGTAYFAHSTDIVRRCAELLGKTKDARLLRDLHRRIVLAFNREYVSSNGRLVGNTQTAYVLSLAFDLLPEEQRPAALDRLVAMIEHNGFRMATGFVGTPLLCPTLARFGRVDVAYKLLLQEEFPSWLYTVNQGATTMWERWNSWTEEKGFGPVSMNSFNHYAYGSIGAWMYASVAGLEVDFEGSETDTPPLRMAPLPGYGLTEARAELETPFGKARSEWTIEDGLVTIELTVPANASARVTISNGTSDIEADLISASGEEVEDDIEELLIHEATDDGKTIFRAAAGRYRIRYTV